MKWAKLLVGAVALLVAGVSPVLGQEEGEDSSRCICVEPFRVHVESFGENWPQVAWMGNRARLGVMVNTRANPETDRYGALIESVTPGGPADKAGIEDGDIITRLNGESLLSGSEVYDEDESAPGMRLVERARNLEAGDTVEVELRRDGETMNVEVVAGDFDGLRTFTFDSGLLDRSMRLRNLAERWRELPEVRVRGPETFALRLGALLPGLELVSLNPQLGEYFGTDEGVLVVTVPEDSELGLRAGDVIQEIDGREVRSPSHAMRILRSYEADEEVTFRVIRQKRERTVTGKVTDPLHGDLNVTIEKEGQ